MKKNTTTLIFILIAVSHIAFAKIILVTNPGTDNDIQPNIQSAVNGAVNGDLIQLPAGKFICNKTVTVNKFVSIAGQGLGQTILYRSESTPDSDLREIGMFRFYPYSSASSGIVISDMTLRSKKPSLADGDGLSRSVDMGIELIKCVDFVVTRCRFEYFGNGAVSVLHEDNLARGLIYKNEFYHNAKGYDALGLGYGVVVYGVNTTWVADPQFGSANFIFIEDNVFDYHRHSVAGGGCGLYVFRHNTVKNNIAGNTAHAIDAHEARLDGSGNNYSTRAIEVYGNSIINTMFKDGTDNCPDGTPIVAGKDPSWLVESAITTRGGEALIFNNYIEGYRFGVGLVANLEFQGPYPIAYQQGYLSGLKYGATHTGVDGDKGDGDNFVWDDSYKSYAPTNKNCVYFYNYSKTDLKEGRDYHLFAKPNYVPYTYPHPLCSSSNPTNTLVLTTSSTTASCINVNGTASVVVKGGNPGVTGYTYSWSTVPVKTTATATGLPSGTYTVTIKDADGNYKMASVLVKKAATPFNLSTVVTSASCNTCADGTVDVLVSGGKSTYSFKWDSQSKSSFSTSSYLTGLAVGSYSVTATDLDGCYKQVTTKISTSVTGIDEANSDKGSMLISPNPSSGKFNISNTNFKENESVSIVLYTIEGKEAFATLATNAGNIISIDAEGRLEAGVYILMAKSPDLILRKSLLITH